VIDCSIRVSQSSFRDELEDVGGGGRKGGGHMLPSGSTPDYKKDVTLVKE